MSGMWLIRAGRKAVYLDEFLDENVVALSMSRRMGAEALGASRKQLVKRTLELHPDWSKYKAGNHAGQLFRFLDEVQIGDRVVTYDPSQRRYYIGHIESEPRYTPSKLESLPYQRTVRWTLRAPRDELSVASRNSLGAIQSIIKVPAQVVKELDSVSVPIDSAEEEVAEVTGPPDRAQADEATLADLRAEMLEKSGEFIEDLIASLEPDELEQLVAGILRAMGYRARVSPKGPDRGVDVFASPDGLGLEEPRIFVEVKHRPKTSMGSQALRAFLGGRQPGDRCLFVSTGGFTKDARYEADRSSVPLTLVGLPELRELLTDHYEGTDVETRRLVPLTRLYWPIAE